MVVEHTFVSTLPPDQALSKASAFLNRGGFIAQVQKGFALDSAGWTSLDVRRGKAISSRYIAIPDLPQRVQIEWDRGRLTVAASISDRHSEKNRSQLLLAIVLGLQAILANGQTEDAAAMEWERLDVELRKSGRWLKVRRWLILLLVVLLWAGIILYYRFR